MSLGARTAKCVSAKNAYALIEIMIAGGLLAFFVFSIYTAFSFGFATIKVSQESVRADQILVQKMETLRMYDWNKVNSGFIPTNFTTTLTTSGGGSGITYNGTISIDPAPVSESYSDTLRQVTATLTWVSSGVPRARSITTFVSQNGIQNYKP